MLQILKYSDFANFETIFAYFAKSRDKNIRLRFKTFLPDSLHTFAKVIEDMTALNASACW